jgi:hypothetical protein
MNVTRVLHVEDALEANVAVATDFVRKFRVHDDLVAATFAADSAGCDA